MSINHNKYLLKVFVHTDNCVFKLVLSPSQDADVLLIVGSNPRFEAPLINSRIRKR